MASRILPISKIAILSLFICVALVSADKEEEEYGLVRDGDDKKHFLGHKMEKLSHFRFYWHDTYSGKNPSAVTIVKPPANHTTMTGFGTVTAFDDPLTAKPELSSKLLGRAEGFYAVSSQEEFSLLIAMNFVFLQGKYNGSTISIFGRNRVPDKVRELPVIGGSGLFRFARGYAQVSTYSYDTASGDAVAEYNVYLLHY
ncbi:hypothetical protein L484_016709 [Morus notabilis]|uniref:Dirigent protein n=1 Tax=Morus notabilis TaxID=981085 RepID=W9RQ57_9ROSA|nr:dirigent protein 19 [Morus notabilis]EXB87363.1 hypothetical protein L484_016709 [Morus notabilis]